MSEIINKELKDKSLNDLRIKEEALYKKPKLTSKKVNKAITMLREVEKNNGHVNIAQACDLSRKQVRTIHKKIQDKIKVLTKEDVVVYE